ncbi:MAG TPA: hypothetical protein VFP71_09790, partial [Candidatus Angelobacter sp.]|nr:hypothetical protein [Candidatus Angelobacter sp.]
SVEQQVQPHLRGKPTAVVTVDADSTVCIAASYEAKAFGVSTGTPLGEARKKCPDLNVVVARHELYVDYHNQIKNAIEENCLHVSKIISIDEMECRLGGRDMQLHNALALAKQVKQTIRSVGETLRCSVGLAPNRFLAKVATNLQKPDGLVTITPSQLPKILFLSQAARPARNRPSDGAAPAQARDYHRGTALAARYGPDDRTLGRRAGNALLAEAARYRFR